MDGTFFACFDAKDNLGLRFEIQVDYSFDSTGKVSFDCYYIEGDVVSREELVERFGAKQVQLLEEEAD